MLRVPYENLAIALMATRTPAAVAVLLDEYGYGKVEAATLAPLRKRLMADRPTPLVPGSRPEEDWLRSHRVYEMVRNTKHAQAAKALFREARYRTVLEMLLTGGVVYQEIADSLLTLSGTVTPVNVVQLYAHYFWNRDEMARRDWREYLVSFGDGGMVDRYPQGRMLYTLYESDPGVALWRAGVRPDLEMPIVLDTMIADAFMRWQELRQEPNTGLLALKMERIGNSLLNAVKVKADQGGAAEAINKMRHQLALAVSQLSRVNGRELLERTEPVESLLPVANVRSLPGKGADR